jgi:hypothetical protein
MADSATQNVRNGIPSDAVIPTLVNVGDCFAAQRRGGSQ